jgi:hypothetical protein
MFAKLFDNLQPRPFPVDHTDEKDELVGNAGRPEAYSYSPT